jgi:hypothetical protein
MQTEQHQDLMDALEGVTWTAPNPFDESAAYLLLHPVSATSAPGDGVRQVADGLGLRRLDREAEMMWVGTDVLAASLRGERVDLWNGARSSWWSQWVTDEWTGAAIARRYIVLAMGITPLLDKDAKAVSAYLRHSDRVYAGLVKIRLRVTDQ